MRSNDPALPESTRREAHRLLRHYPSADNAFRAAKQELLDTKFILEPVFGQAIDFESDQRER